MRIFAKTDKGIIRTDNQDAYINGTLSDGAVYAVVCDGMGGVSGGNVASDIAVKAIKEEIFKKYTENLSDTQIRRLYIDAIDIANSIIYEIASKEKTLTGMGTTVVAVLIKNNIAHILHAGDSRAYIIADNNIRQLTKDHSYVQDMVDMGQLTSEEAKRHPKKNIITRAIGIEKNIDVEYTNIAFNKNDILLICTDGLTNHVDDNEIFKIIQEGADGACDKLIAKAKSLGGSDNITIVLITD